MFVAVTLALLAGASPPVTMTSAPSALTSYVKDGHFDPGDFAWYRGRFDAASTAEGDRWRMIKDWSDTRAAEQTASVSRELSKAGITPKALRKGCYGDEVCDCIQDADRRAQKFGDWTTFETGLMEAKPYLAAYRLAYGNIFDAIGDKTATWPPGERLLAAVIPDQTMRYGVQREGDEHGLALSAGGREAFNLLIWSDIIRLDATNTKILKAIVEKQGWPKISVVGDAGAQNAWLLAQHADADPVFQLKVLRLMEPMTKTGEASQKLFGYLYDRVMLGLTGMQKFGTQFECKNGHYAPSPLEDASQVETLRVDAGMPTMAVYAKMLPSSC